MLSRKAAKGIRNLESGIRKKGVQRPEPGRLQQKRDVRGIEPCMLETRNLEPEPSDLVVPSS